MATSVGSEIARNFHRRAAPSLGSPVSKKRSCLCEAFAESRNVPVQLKRRIVDAQSPGGGNEREHEERKKRNEAKRQELPACPHALPTAVLLLQCVPTPHLETSLLFARIPITAGNCKSTFKTDTNSAKMETHPVFYEFGQAEYIDCTDGRQPVYSRKGFVERFTLVHTILDYQFASCTEYSTKNLHVKVY